MNAELECAEALRIVATSTRSGESLEYGLAAAGIRAKGEIAESFMAAAMSLRLGRSLTDSLLPITRHLSPAASASLIATLGIQQRRGGDLGRVCQRLAYLLHEQSRLRSEARSATAQARFTARAVIVMPVLAFAGWAWRSPDTLSAVFGTNRLLLVLPAFALAAIGLALIVRVSRSALEFRDDALLPCMVAVLELSLAILEAGGTVNDAVSIALAMCPRPLRESVAPAVAQIRLGRDPESALASMRVSKQIPELRLWCSTMIDSDRRGVSCQNFLETMLRDARTSRREQFRARAAVAGPRIQLLTVMFVVPPIVWIALVATATNLFQQLSNAGIA